MLLLALMPPSSAAMLSADMLLSVLELWLPKISPIMLLSMANLPRLKAGSANAGKGSISPQITQRNISNVVNNIEGRALKRRLL